MTSEPWETSASSTPSRHHPRPTLPRNPLAARLFLLVPLCLLALRQPRRLHLAEAIYDGGRQGVGGLHAGKVHRGVGVGMADSVDVHRLARGQVRAGLVEDQADVVFGLELLLHRQGRARALAVMRSLC